MRTAHALIRNFGIATLVVASLAAGASAVLAAPAMLGRAALVHRGFVESNGLAVAVPPIGTGVTASALLAGGGELTLTVVTDAWGRPWIVDATVDTDLARPSGTTPIAECSDGAYKLHPYWWHSTVKWWFKRVSTPTNLGQGGAETVIETAMDNITGARNNCGRADHIDAAATYKGTTESGANISTSSKCLQADGDNVVAFGDLADTHLGLTCNWFSGDKIKESDVRYNKHDFTWVLHKSGCSGDERVIENTATHEFGHVFGLAHITGAEHANLTMYPSSGPCDAFKTTLGLGDMKGLEVHY